MIIICIYTNVVPPANGTTHLPSPSHWTQVRQYEVREHTSCAPLKHLFLLRAQSDSWRRRGLCVWFALKSYPLVSEILRSLCVLTYLSVHNYSTFPSQCFLKHFPLLPIQPQPPSPNPLKLLPHSIRILFILFIHLISNWYQHNWYQHMYYSEAN